MNRAGKSLDFLNFQVLRLLKLKINKVVFGEKFRPGRLIEQLLTGRVIE